MEHKHNKFYWEMVSMLTKIIIVVISIVYNDKLVVKGSLVSLILVGYLLLCFKMRPFITSQLNNLSILGSITQIVTIVLIMSLNDLGSGFKAFRAIFALIIFGLNGYFSILSVYLMVMDFKLFLREKFIVYFPNFSILYNYC